MPTYSTHELQQALHAVCEEKLGQAAWSGSIAGRQGRPAWIDCEEVRAAAALVKLVGFSTRDLVLIGAAELICMGIEKLQEDVDGGDPGTGLVPHVAAPTEHLQERGVNYSSEEIKL